MAFTIAAILEILGCFTFWVWLRRDASPAIAALAILSLIGFAVALTRVDAAFAGGAYAAHGGIYIAASLGWLWLVEGQQPTATDMLGASIAIIGAIVIVGLARSSQTPRQFDLWSNSLKRVVLRHTATRLRLVASGHESPLSPLAPDAFNIDTCDRVIPL